MIPEIRFPQFSGEWQENRFGNYLQSVSSGRSSTVTDGSTYCIYGSTGEIGLSDSFDYSGDKLLIARVGANAGSIYRVQGKYKVSDNTLIVNLSSNLETSFTQSLLEKSNLARLVFGSGQPLVTGGQLKKLKIAVPRKSEQEKIAKFLTLLSERVRIGDEKIKLLQRYKKGLMQDIFTQRVRFKNNFEYPEWESKTLGSIGSTYTGLTGKSADDFGDGSNFITYKQIFNSSRINTDKFGKVNIAREERQNRVKRGDIFFTTSSETPGEVGYTSVLLEDVQDTYLNSFCFGYRADIQVLLPEFAGYFFHSRNIRNRIARLAQGSTRFNLSKNQLMRLSVKLPVVEEQRSIAALLAAIDDKIMLEQIQIVAIKKWKKGLLERMLV